MSSIRETYLKLRRNGVPKREAMVKARGGAKKASGKKKAKRGDG